MFGQRTHPGYFKSVLLLEDCVSDDKLPLSAKFQQQATVVIAVTNTISTKYSFPGICILGHSSIEITKEYHLVICRGALETAPELWVELVFFCRFSLKSWSVHTEKDGILLIFQRKAHGHHAVRMTSRQIFQPGGYGGADLKTNTWKGPLLLWVSLTRRGCIWHHTLGGCLLLGSRTH